MCIFFFLWNNGSYQLVSYASFKVAVWKVYTLNFVPSPFGRRDIRTLTLIPQIGNKAFSCLRGTNSSARKRKRRR